MQTASKQVDAWVWQRQAQSFLAQQFLLFTEWLCGQLYVVFFCFVFLCMLHPSSSLCSFSPQTRYIKSHLAHLLMASYEGQAEWLTALHLIAMFSNQAT